MIKISCVIIPPDIIKTLVKKDNYQETMRRPRKQHKLRVCLLFKKFFKKCFFSGKIITLYCYNVLQVQIFKYINAKKRG